MDVEQALSRAMQAKAAGRWGDARRELEVILEQEENVAALKELGDACWWLGDAARSVEFFERAYSISRENGDLFGAAEIAIWLAAIYEKCLGNRSACRGWLANSERLIEAGQLHPLRAWLMWAEAIATSDPEVTKTLCERAIELAREMGDRDIELAALAELGKAYVELGMPGEGLPMIDEAMAAAMGEEDRAPDTVVAACCSMMGACDQAADLERIAEWCRAADKFMKTYGSPFLFADCRLRYASVLMATGHWEEAERELRHAAGVTTPDTAYYASSMSQLATLRLCQGRVEEAEALLAPMDGWPSALLPQARLHHVRGEQALAARIITRLLESPSEPVERAQALDLLASCRIVSGDLSGARDAVQNLATLSSGGLKRIEAHHLFAAGRLELAEGDPSAERTLELAMRSFSECRLAYETARARLALADALRGEPEVAVAEAQGAFSTFERLGAVSDADAAAVLIRSLGGSARSGPKSIGVLTKREQEVLRLIGAGLSNPEIAERLFLSRKTVSHHVSNILTKLGLRNRAEAAVEASRSLTAAYPPLAAPAPARPLF